MGELRGIKKMGEDVQEVLRTAKRWGGCARKQLSGWIWRKVDKQDVDFEFFKK